MTRISSVSISVLLLSVACSSDIDGNDPKGSGGALGTGGQTTSSGGQSQSSGGSSPSAGGSTASGGSTPSSGGSNDNNAGGTSPSGGMPAAGGTTPGDGGSESGGASMTGGMPGTGGDVGSGGSSNSGDPVPSAGCGKAGPMTGSAGGPLNVANHDYYVKLPNGYDENTPYPVIIMFNPTGNPIDWAENNAGYEAAAGAEAIRVYPHMSNQSNGWNSNDESFFAPFHAKILEDYCVDESRVFAAGESSGGDMAAVIGCRHGDLLRAIAPGAVKTLGGWFSFNPGSEQCVGQVAAIVIHSGMDNVVGTAGGEMTRDFYHAVNNCAGMEMSTPVDGYSGGPSNCVQFDGCDEGFPTYACWHNDPTYSNTYHGWPAFAGAMTWEVFSQF